MANKLAKLQSFLSMDHPEALSLPPTWNFGGGQVVPNYWTTALFAIFCHWQTYSCFGVWRGAWQTSSSPRRASTRTWRGSADLLALRTSPPPSGGSMSILKDISASPIDPRRKAKNRNWPNYNFPLFISLFRKLSKHTTYIPVSVDSSPFRL